MTQNGLSKVLKDGLKLQISDDTYEQVAFNWSKMGEWYSVEATGSATTSSTIHELEFLYYVLLDLDGLF